MSDVNKRAIHLSKMAIKEQNLEAKVFESDAYQNITDKYDYIISNPPIRVGKKILHEILFGAKNYLNEKGQLWIVVNKAQGAKSLVKDLSSEYKVEIKNKSKGFYIICASNY